MTLTKTAILTLLSCFLTYALADHQNRYYLTQAKADNLTLKGEKERALVMAENAVVQATSLTNAVSALSARPIKVEAIVPSNITITLDPPLPTLPSLTEEPPHQEGPEESLLLPFPALPTN